MTTPIVSRKGPLEPTLTDRLNDKAHPLTAEEKAESMQPPKATVLFV